MKKTIYTLLLTTLFSLTGLNAWAELSTTEIDGKVFYEITSATDLVDFANLVSSGNTTANAILTQDIDCSSVTSWTSIGIESKRYKGTFDGQGHVISNLNISGSISGFGLFYTTAGVTLKNFIIDSSCSLTSTKDCIGVVGKHVAQNLTEVSTFSCIGCAATITSTASENPAGLIGGCWGQKDVEIIIEKCWTSGTITSSDAKKSNTGAFVGWLNGGKLVVNNSWSIATVNSPAAEKYLVRPANNSNTTVTFNNCYSLNGTQVTKLEGVTANDLATGGITYAINGKSSENPIWFQTIGTDPYPVADATHGTVYQNGRQHCNGIAYDGVSYSNVNLGNEQDEHTLVEGICSVCGALLNENYMTLNAEGFFEISNANQLRWFAAYVNAGNNTAKAMLTQGIDMSLASVGWWEPIGKNIAYGGTFDGKDYTISNFNYVGSGDYNGLFGRVIDGTVKNFSINGSLVCAGQGNGTIGWGEGVLISNVHSALIITTPATGGIVHGAGIIGDARYSSTGGGSTMERCSFSGTLDINADSHDCFAGIVGYVNDYCLIKDCANYGTITYAKNNCYAGGILGYVNNNNCYGTHNCLNIGEVKYVGEGNATYGGAIVGRLRGGNPDRWGNSYYKQGSSAKGSSELQFDKNIEVTAEQLASGEIAYKLGTAFRQNIGTDENPVLDATHGIVNEISAAGYATQYITETDVIIPAGVKAYTGEFESTWLKLNAVDGKIAAGEPIVLKGNAGYYSFVPTTGATKASENVLKGTAEDIEAIGKYVLAKPEGKDVGFYLANGGNIKAGKAYLEIPGGSEVKSFTFVFDEDATGIASHIRKTEEGDPIFNLAGQRLSKMQKGINIVNGKKVLY